MIAIDVSGVIDRVGVPVGIVLLSLLSLTAGAAATSFLGRWAEATNRRRDAYAGAIQALVAWVEYPYRIRRRTADDPGELARLANAGHDLQERLRCHQMWVTAESAYAGRGYRATLKRISSLVGPCCNEAWNTSPIVVAADMSLGQWGPGREAEPLLDALQVAITWRFGWRRLVGSVYAPARPAVSGGEVTIH